MSVGQERGEHLVDDLALSDDPLLHLGAHRLGHLGGALEELDVHVGGGGLIGGGHAVSPRRSRREDRREFELVERARRPARAAGAAYPIVGLRVLPPTSFGDRTREGANNDRGSAGRQAEKTCKIGLESSLRFFSQALPYAGCAGDGAEGAAVGPHIPVELHWRGHGLGGRT